MASESTVQGRTGVLASGCASMVDIEQIRIDTGHPVDAAAVLDNSQSTAVVS